MTSRVALTVPPQPRSLAVVRTTVGGAAARAHLTLDQVEDLRMAVEEAAVHLLRANPPWLEVEVVDAGDRVDVIVRAPVPEHTRLPPVSEFAALLLDSLADTHRSEHDGDGARIVLSLAKPT